MSSIKTGDECPCLPVQKEREIVQFFFSLNHYLEKGVCLKSSWIQRVTLNQWRSDSCRLELRSQDMTCGTVWPWGASTASTLPCILKPTSITAFEEGCNFNICKHLWHLNLQCCVYWQLAQYDTVQPSHATWRVCSDNLRVCCGSHPV